MSRLPGGALRLALLTNTLAPYRLPIYRRLAEHFDVTVLYSGDESNRSHWQASTAGLQGFRVKRSRGIVIPWLKRDRGAVLDARYLHLNPGFLSDLLRIRPDAVVSDEMGFRTLVALLYTRLFGAPLWVWWGGTLHTERGIGLLRRLLRRRLAPVTRGWFSYGVTSTEYLESLGVPRTSIVELQNCVPESPYLERVPPALQLVPKPVVLCVSRLVPGKGVNLLLEAAAQVQAQGESFTLLLVGDGPEKSFLEGRVAQLGLRNVVFHPAEPPDRVPALYQSGDVLVFPTLDDVWGLVVNEALWSGLPALVSIYAGCAKELVPPGSTFDPLDPIEFAAKLRLGVTGQLPRPERSRMRRVDEVSGLMIRALDGQGAPA